MNFNTYEFPCLGKLIKIFFSFPKKRESKGELEGKEKKERLIIKRGNLSIEIAVKVSLTFQNLTSNMEVMFFLHFMYEE